MPFFFLRVLEDSSLPENAGFGFFFFFLPVAAAVSSIEFTGPLDFTSFTWAGASAALVAAGNGVVSLGATVDTPPLSGCAEGHALAGPVPWSALVAAGCAAGVVLVSAPAGGCTALAGAPGALPVSAPFEFTTDPFTLVSPPETSRISRPPAAGALDFSGAPTTEPAVSGFAATALTALMLFDIPTAAGAGLPSGFTAHCTSAIEPFTTAGAMICGGSD